jgi:hypothetical protein
MNHLKLFLLIAAFALLAANCEKITPDSGTPDYTTQKQPRRPGPPIGEPTPDGKDSIEQWQMIRYYTVTSCGDSWTSNPSSPPYGAYRLFLNWTAGTYMVYPCWDNYIDTIANPARRGNFHFTFRENASDTPLGNCVYSQFIFDTPIIVDYPMTTFIAHYRGNSYTSFPLFYLFNDELINFGNTNVYPDHQFLMLSPGETMNWSIPILGQAIFVKIDPSAGVIER